MEFGGWRAHGLGDDVDKGTRAANGKFGSMFAAWKEASTSGVELEPTVFGFYCMFRGIWTLFWIFIYLFGFFLLCSQIKLTDGMEWTIENGA